MGGGFRILRVPTPVQMDKLLLTFGRGDKNMDSQTKGYFLRLRIYRIVDQEKKIALSGCERDMSKGDIEAIASIVESKSSRTDRVIKKIVRAYFATLVAITVPQSERQDVLILI
jgi:hypothetical protein